MMTPELEDVIQEFVDAGLGSTHTMIPGVVQSYDNSDQTATVRPAVRSYRVNAADDTLESYLPEAVKNVPVMFPSSDDGNKSITFPMSNGDRVQLVVAERSIDEWKSADNDDNEPRDLRRFDLSDAVALPQGRSPAAPLGSDAVDASAMVIASDSEIHLGKAGPSSFVALASDVKSELDSLKTTIDNFVTVYNSHIHTAPSGPTSTTPSQASAHGAVGDVKSAKVKSE